MIFGYKFSELCETVYVNTGCVNSSTTVTVDGISSYNCPTQVDKTNWISTATYGDTFEVTMNGDSITVTRTDGQESGWCVSLSFKCCKGVVLIASYPLLK